MKNGCQMMSPQAVDFYCVGSPFKQYCIKYLIATVFLLSVADAQEWPILNSINMCTT